jgi:hypothetical protein
LVALSAVTSVIPGGDKPEAEQPEPTPPAIVETVSPGIGSTPEIEADFVEPNVEELPEQNPEVQPAPTPEVDKPKEKPVEDNPVETPVVVAPEPVVETPVEEPKQEAVKEEAPPAQAEIIPEADPEKAFRESLTQYNYVGSSESDKYHFPTCRWTNAIHEYNLVHFDSIEEAKAFGYSPCGSCQK